MRTVLGPVSQFPLDTPTTAHVADQQVVVVRRSHDEVCVFLDHCPHMGLRLSRGPRGGYADGVITCPWHNSEFDVCSGENLDWAPGFAGVKVPGWSRKLIAMGRKPAPLTTFDARVEDGSVVVDG
jgi:nitrite reductase/ring-hydroxylating ferredoxin subunit